MCTIEKMLINQFHKGYSAFQNNALQAAILERVTIVDSLLEFVENSIKKPFRITNFDDDKQNEFTKALILLAELQEERALPLIVKLFSLNQKKYRGASDFFDDLKENYGLSRILASVCNDQLDLIKEVIEDSKFDPCVRISALESLLVLYNSDRLTRKELIEYFQTLLDKNISQKKDEYFILDLIKLIGCIYPAELNDSLLQYSLRISQQSWVDYDMFDLLQEFSYRGLSDSVLVCYMSMISNSMKEGKESILARLKDNYELRSIDKGFTEFQNWHSPVLESHDD